MKFRNRVNEIEQGQSADVAALSRRPRVTAPRATRRLRVPPAYGRFGVSAVDRVCRGPSASPFPPVRRAHVVNRARPGPRAACKSDRACALHMPSTT
jgi:hypothetical protein